MLTKFIYTSEIHLNQRIKYLLTEKKKYGLRTEKIQKHLLFFLKKVMTSMKV